ncbi:MAG: RnfABCDGE type electron transport complex subunit B [Halothiobacillaceae bacterium]|nr:RnfABCDGE type electron transport complex subunit B [Halothiobacillaceae bacterium]
MVAVLSLTGLGLLLGLGLGVAAKFLRVEQEDGRIAEVEALLPGSQCGQCGFPGCAPAAAALVAGAAPVTLCPPGGRDLVEKLAALLGVEADTAGMAETVPMLAIIEETQCIGCTKCFKVCPTDAVIGATRQVHNVLREACTGCGKCVDVCPTLAISLEPVPATLQSWTWHKPPRELPVLNAPLSTAGASC